MSISNQQFWALWKKGLYDEALQCAVKEEKKKGNRLQAMMFGTPEQLKQTGAVTSISVGEFVYDYMMINPTVVQGLDFARTEDLSSLFSLSQFSSQIDRTILTGDIAQLQGYVAEQMIAVELQAKGHDVEFPETSNNPGWDILVDGLPFQVKSLANPDGVRQHLSTYPDIPVYVNEELASFFEGNPQVYVSSVSREDVLEVTKSTLAHADDLLDFEIPWIAAGVSSIFNINRVWKDEVSIDQAVLNIVSDTSSRVVLGAFGKKAGIIAGTMLFGPAGGITGAMFGAYLGGSQGGRLSTGIKRVISKKQEQELINAMKELLIKVIEQIEQKLSIKTGKMDNLKSWLQESRANESVIKEAERHLHVKTRYLLNKKEELINIFTALNNGTTYVFDILPNTMAVITKTGVHPAHFQEELKLVQQKSKEYFKKV